MILILRVNNDTEEVHVHEVSPGTWTPAEALEECKKRLTNEDATFTFYAVEATGLNGYSQEIFE